MRVLDFYEEQFRAQGGISAEGVTNTLGRPKMHPLEIMLREAVQNTWDARSGPDSAVHFNIAYRTLTREQRRFLIRRVFSSVPPNSGIAEMARLDPIRVLTLQDYGTTGLDGPLFADQRGDGRRKQNFVDFVWKVGRSQLYTSTGGTYGFGKAAFYSVSGARTICIYSRCIFKGEPQYRFIVSSLSPQAQNSRNTGRCWWGWNYARKGIGPVVGADARYFAESVGCPSFPRGECGTTIMIFDPDTDLGDDSDEPDIASVRLSDLRAIVPKWFWPLMSEGKAEKGKIHFKIQMDGRKQDIVSCNSEPYATYKSVLHELRKKQEGLETDSDCVVKPIISQRPAQFLGFLLLRHFVRSARRNRTGASGSSGPSDRSHHVALLRSPGLVVRYLEGPPTASEYLEYAGVFVPDSEVEAAFALSEPPAHDDWIPEYIQGRAQDNVSWCKRYVSIALRKIRDEMYQFTEAPQIQPDGGRGLPLGVISDHLGTLLSTASSGIGADYGRQPSSGSDGSRSGRVSQSGASAHVIEEKIRLIIHEGTKAIVFPIEVHNASLTAGKLLTINPSVIIDGAEREKDPPHTGQVPAVLQYVAPSGKTINTSDPVDVSDSDDGIWQVLVSVPEDLVVGIAPEFAERQSQTR